MGTKRACILDTVEAELNKVKPMIEKKSILRIFIEECIKTEMAS